MTLKTYNVVFKKEEEQNDREVKADTYYVSTAQSNFHTFENKDGDVLAKFSPDVVAYVIEVAREPNHRYVLGTEKVFIKKIELISGDDIYICKEPTYRVHYVNYIQEEGTTNYTIVTKEGFDSLVNAINSAVRIVVRDDGTTYFTRA